MTTTRQTLIGNIAAHAILILGAVTMIAPFLWMISTSLKDLGEVFIFPPRWLPKYWSWGNYLRIWQAKGAAGDVFIASFGQQFLNSFKITILGTVGQIFSCSIAAYAFARLQFRGRNVIFVILLMTMMLPFQLTVIPIFYTMSKLRWIDTHLPLIIPFFCGGAYGTFLIRQFFLTIPSSFGDAAKIDGCNPFKIYYYLYLPLSMPVLATLTVFTFMWRWNDLFGPLVFVHTPAKMTVTLGLTAMQGQFWTDIPLLMTGSLISLLPTLILFIALQRFFIQGVVLAGIKG